MLEGLLIKYAGTIGQNGLFLLIMGWCIMKIGSLAKTTNAISEALKFKTDEKMCEQKHNEQDKHMVDLKAGNTRVEGKLDNLIEILLKENLKGD